MPDTDSRPPVVVDYNIHWGAKSASENDTFEIPREVWDVLTPEQRNSHIEVIVEEIVNNTVTYGWNVADPADAAGLPA